MTAQVRQGGIAAYDFAALNPWRFSSEYADDALGCNYYNYREYEPVTGRWMSRDPAGEMTMVLYAFCANRIGNDILGLALLLKKGIFVTDGVIVIERNGGTEVYKGLTPKSFIDIINAAAPCSIDRIEFRGHAKPQMIECFGSESDGSIFFDKDLQNGPQVVAPNDGCDLAKLLRGKIKCHGRIDFKGCHTASGKDNLAKRLSEHLPGVDVAGYAFYAIDLKIYFVWCGAIINPVSWPEIIYTDGVENNIKTE